MTIPKLRDVAPAPHEETWTACGNRVDTPGGHIETWVNPPIREPAICLLIAAAPAMAQLLVAIVERFNEREYDEGGEFLGQALREQFDDVLVAAGVDAPKMAKWRRGPSGRYEGK